MIIRYANDDDFMILNKYDKHISKEQLKNSINSNKIIVMYKDKKFIGWLRFNLFWDNIPFMNMLYFLEDYRGKEYGKKMVEYWEKEMKNNGYNLVLTSTQSNENAQYFYRKLNYIDNGCLLLPNEPLEIILYKKI